ncbi:MAG: enoyl-CoA hydratase-related protein [Alphaproteobacteria bacterium]|jgi:2-(1,2-epoxy-1,2-dihydrophenyl)acetyl-CoA isomerase|nr:enoyl-CoA hydratase-related protein [Alphaproteobacteria bacterium]MDP6872724.1 enoyl-CoA hydratase-related protein [Alphaproteobacteria bacterium]
MTAKTLDTGTDHLLARQEDGVLVITLNRPEARNALSDQLSPALRRMLAAAAEDDSVGALLLTGTGTAFCAGGDVKGMGGNSAKKAMTAEERIADLQQRQRTLTGALFSMPQPTIAALPGPAVGAGLAIALACDIRIAAASAFVSTGYRRVALSGDYGLSWTMTRLVGTARAREFMFSGERIEAERAERIGLVNRVVADEELQDAAMDMARSFAEGPRTAQRLMKENLELAMQADFLTALDHEAEQLIKASAHPDHGEAVRAFIEKRLPVFGKSDS